MLRSVITRGPEVEDNGRAGSRDSACHVSLPAPYICGVSLAPPPRRPGPLHPAPTSPGPLPAKSGLPGPARSAATTLMTSASPPLHSKLYLLALLLGLLLPLLPSLPFRFRSHPASFSSHASLVLPISISPIASSIRYLVPSQANP